MQKKRLTVGLIFGGKSVEHEISLRSAKKIYPILREAYDVVPIGITPGGYWMLGIDPTEIEKALPDSDSEFILGLYLPKGEVILGGVRERIARLMASPHTIDVLFPIIHGTFGEDGTLQGLAEMLGIPYVGSPVLASAIGMDKAIFKDVLRANNLPIIDYVLIKSSDWYQTKTRLVRHMEEIIGYPCFVKPTNLGSSIGVTKAKDRQALLSGIEQGFEFGSKVLVERAINAREIEIAILGNDDLLISVPGEPIYSRDFYNYEAKYIDKPRKVIPATIPKVLREEARKLAARVYRIIDAAGFARLDFLFDQDSGKLYINEINTLPALSPGGMYAKLCEESGISYQVLIKKLIELAIQRHQKRLRLRTRM